MHQTILITGGAGFVGSNIAIRFKKDNPNWCIISLDNLKRRGSETNLGRLNDAGVKFVYGDVRNKNDIFKAQKQCVQKINTIIDCAAEPSIMAGVNESPEYIIETNLIGTINCLELARQNSSNFILISTSRVYPIEILNKIVYEESPLRFLISKNQNIIGVSEKGISEMFPLDGVRSMYGATKFSAELIMREYIEIYNVRGVINRCGVIAGPWQMGKIDQGIISLWIAGHLFKNNLSYIGFGGKQVRDVLHVDDLCELLKIQIKNINKYNGKIYNVGGGLINSTSLRELTEICQQVSGNKIEISDKKKIREFDVPVYVSDCSKIERESGWKPVKRINKTIEDTYKWMFENKDILKRIFVT